MPDPITVVLVDDHPVVRSGIRILLERAPDIRVVAEGERGDLALQLVQQYQPDVLLLDMELPGMTGLEVARAIQSAGLAVKVLALSAYDDEEYIIGLLSNGAAGYLTKEEALNTIVDAVRGVAQGEEGWMSRRAAARMAERVRRDDTDLVALTEREEEVLKLLAKGWSNQQIAQELTVTERTVRFHLTNVYDKLGVNTRAEAIAWALRAEPHKPGTSRPLS
jgi:DNA-binding NarL/FixJ family response regulator